MKCYKRIIASVLAFLMIVSGIYFVQSEDGSETVKAAETADVSTDMLEVKAQIATDGSNVIRFITSVDSLDYARVGFELTPAGGTKKVYETKTVYERIVSAPDATGVKYEFGPKAVDVSSEYFVTAKLRATAGVDYTVKAFVRTQTGEIVYGKSRCVALSDGAADATTVNMSFENTAAAGVKVADTLNVSYAGKTTTAAVIGVDGTTVHVRVNVDVDTLPSATKFTFSGTAAGSTIYRNLYTTHVPKSGTAVNADTTWYDVYKAENANETKFVIATTADLYGFASLVTGGNTFAGLSAYLCADLKVNTNTPSNPHLATSWTNYTPQYKWTPMATSSKMFAGTLDGDGHRISGLYANKATGTTESTNGYVGLFGYTDTSCVVKDLKILDSCFVGYRNVGSISGYGGGTFKGIYSNAYLSTQGSDSAQRTGGIIGRAVKSTLIQETEFAGWASTETQRVGGFIGETYSTVATLQDVKFSGTVTALRSYSGGFGNGGGLCGFVTDGAAMLVANNCLIVGDILFDAKEGTETVGVTGGVGEHIGRVGANCEYDVNGVYTMNGCCAKVAYVGSMAGVYHGGESANVGRRFAEEYVQGVNAYTNMPFNFVINEADANEENVWIAIADKVPELKKFSDAVALELTSSLKADTKWYTAAVADADENAPGTEANPYVIKDADDFYGFSTLVNAGTTFENKHLVLANDITINTNAPEKADKIESWSEYTPQFTWVPIGQPTNSWSATKQFAGSFDGQDHIIRGIYVKDADNERWAGLFGATRPACEMKNFTFTDSYIEGHQQVGGLTGRGGGTFTNITSDVVVVSSKTDSYAGNSAGGFLGQSAGENITMTNCHYSGEVQSADESIGGFVAIAGSCTLNMENCSFEGTVNGGKGNAGGLVGYISAATATIEECVTNGTVKATTDMTGNAVGQINGACTVTISKNQIGGSCEALGIMAGAVVGRVNGSATVNLTENLVTGSAKALYSCGGMIGVITGKSAKSAVVNITDCHFSGSAEVTTPDRPQNLGELCGKIEEYSDVTATRCLLSGELQIAQSDRNWANALVGMVTGNNATLDCSYVYFVGSKVNIPNFGYISIYNPDENKDGTVDFTNCGWKSSSSHATIKNVAESAITGNNATSTMNGITFGSDKVWVLRKEATPTLRIFANEADIIQ